MKPNYFLAKTEPSTYSISDLKKDKVTLWDGVHSHQANNVIASWQIGDLVLIYHSVTQKQITGLAKVISLPRPNPNDPRPSMVADLEFVREFEPEKRISLKQIKDTGLFADLPLVRQGRLSTMAVPAKFITWLESQGLDLSMG